MNLLKIDKSSVVIRVGLLIMAAVFSFVLIYSNLTPADVTATTEAELNANLDALEEELAAGEATLKSLENEVDSLENKLDVLATQITQIETKIEKTQVELDKLSVELEKAEAEEARQKELLTESLRELYIHGNVSTMDLILASEDFSDFVNQTEYLDKLKDNVADATKKTIALREEIAANKAAQEELLAEQQSQRKGLKDTQKEQQDILEYTKGQEARYKTMVSDLEDQRREAEKELQDFIDAQNFVSLGHVYAGNVIGRMGTTGYSTGVHLHLGIYRDGVPINPYAGGTSLISGYTWPTSSTRVTQTFGCVAPYYWYITKCSNGKSKHTGLDIGASTPGVPGDPIYAIADGEIIFRGWFGGYGNLVIIDHGGGIQSYYGHLQE